MSDNGDSISPRRRGVKAKLSFDFGFRPVNRTLNFVRLFSYECLLTSLLLLQRAIYVVLFYGLCTSGSSKSSVSDKSNFLGDIGRHEFLNVHCFVNRHLTVFGSILIFVFIQFVKFCIYLYLLYLTGDSQVCEKKDFPIFFQYIMRLFVIFTILTGIAPGLKGLSGYCY